MLTRQAGGRNNAERPPSLNQLDLKYLSITATSACSARCLSGAGKCYTKLRARLMDEPFQNLV